MSSSMGTPPSPSRQFSDPSPLHGGSTDPNEVRRRAQQTQMVSSHPITPPNHGGNTDPNEVRLQLAHYTSTQSSSPPPDHGGNADPNAVRQRLNQSQSAIPSIQGQGRTYTTTRTVSSQESTMQYPTPSPSPYGGPISSSLSPLLPTHQPQGQPQSSYFQGSQTTQSFSGPPIQHSQVVGAGSPPPGNYGSPSSQISSQSYSAQTQGSPNQQNNVHGGQSSQIPQGISPQVRNQSLLLARVRN